MDSGGVNFMHWKPPHYDPKGGLNPLFLFSNKYNIEANIFHVIVK